MVAWRLVFVAQAVAWLGFVIGGSVAVGQEYPQESNRDFLLFAVMLAVLSLPVAIYWGYRWHNQKRYFDESDDVA